MRPWDEGCLSSLFVGASPDFPVDKCGAYFDQKANVAEVRTNAAANDENEQVKSENWSREEMKKGGWI